MQNIRASNNQTAEVSIPGTPVVTTVDRPPILLINAPKPPPVTPIIEYKDDKGTTTEDFQEVPKEKSHCGLYSLYVFFVLLYTILCFVIYTFILYGIGTAFLKSHYHISINGKTLSLNSLDVLRYPGVYSVFTTAQTASIDRELFEENNEFDINNDDIIDLDNDVKYNNFNKVKASAPSNRRTAIIDGQNDLYLRSRGLETTDVSIDGKTKMLGDVMIGDTNHTNNLKINGTIDVESIKVNKVIDLTSATLKYNAPNPNDFTESYQNISIGQLDAKVINVQSTLCNITASDITNINDLLFLKPNIVTVRKGNLVLKGDKEANGRIEMLTDVDAPTINTEYINIGLKDSEKKINIRGDDNSIKNVINLESDYITTKSIKVSEINAILDTIKMKNTVDMESNLLKTTKIQNSDTIQTLNVRPLDDKDYISLYGINVLGNNEMTNILKLRTNQLFADEIQVSNAGSLSIKSDINMNDYSITNVKTISSTNLDVTKLLVNSISSKEPTNPISIESDMLCNRIVKINEIDPTNVGNKILINGDISLENRIITNVVDTQTDKLTVKNIISKNNDGSPIIVNSGMKFESTITAGILNVETIQRSISGGGVIKVNSDINQPDNKFTSGEITVSNIVPKDLQQIFIGITSGTVTLNGNVKYTGRITGDINMDKHNIKGIGQLEGENSLTSIKFNSEIQMLSKDINMDGNRIYNIGTLQGSPGSSISITSNVYMPDNTLTVKQIQTNGNQLKFSGTISFDDKIKIYRDEITGLKKINSNSESFEILGTFSIGSITVSGDKIDMKGAEISNLKSITGYLSKVIIDSDINMNGKSIENLKLIDNSGTLKIKGDVHIPDNLILPYKSLSNGDTGCVTTGYLAYSATGLFVCMNGTWKEIPFNP